MKSRLRIFPGDPLKSEDLSFFSWVIASFISPLGAPLAGRIALGGCLRRLREGRNSIIRYGEESAFQRASNRHESSLPFSLPLSCRAYKDNGGSRDYET